MMTSFTGNWRTRGHLREVGGAARSGAWTRAASRRLRRSLIQKSHIRQLGQRTGWQETNQSLN
jgi:hypothetical protein